MGDRAEMGASWLFGWLGWEPHPAMPAALLPSPPWNVVGRRRQAAGGRKGLDGIAGFFFWQLHGDARGVFFCLFERVI